MNAPYHIPDSGEETDYADTRRCAPTAFGTIGKAIVLRCIEHCTDPAEKKERIMTARQDGHLTPDEATALIRKHGLEDA